MAKTYDYITQAFNLRNGWTVRHEGVLRKIVKVRIDGNYTTVSLEGLAPFVVRSVDNLTVVSDN